MPSVRIDDLPEETYAGLLRRAAASHQSLQDYLRSRLIDEAARPTMAEVFDRIERKRFGGSMPPAQAVAVVRKDRDDR